MLDSPRTHLHELPQLHSTAEYENMTSSVKPQELRHTIGRKLFKMFSGPAWSLWDEWTEKEHEIWYGYADAILALLPAPGAEVTREELADFIVKHGWEAPTKLLEVFTLHRRTPSQDTKGEGNRAWTDEEIRQGKNILSSEPTHPYR